MRLVTIAILFCFLFTACDNQKKPTNNDIVSYEQMLKRTEVITGPPWAIESGRDCYFIYDNTGSTVVEIRCEKLLR